MLFGGQWERFGSLPWREEEVGPLFLWGSLLFWAEKRRHPFRKRKRGCLVLWHGAKGASPPVYEVRNGLAPRPSLEGEEAPAPRDSGRGRAASPCAAPGWVQAPALRRRGRGRGSAG